MDLVDLTRWTWRTARVTFRGPDTYKGRRCETPTATLYVFSRKIFLRRILSLFLYKVQVF